MIVFRLGWIGGALVMLALACILVGFLGFLLLVNKAPRKGPESQDTLWHRYVEGDITREEFDHLRARRT